MTETARLQTDSMDARLWTQLILLSVIWGGSFFFGRVAMAELPPLTTAFFRVFLAALALIGWILITRRQSAGFTLHFALSVLVMGLLNNAIPFSLILWGQIEIGSGLAAAVNAMTPIWTLLVANALTSDEKIAAPKLIGVLIGFAGVVLLMAQNALSGLTAPLLAQLAVLGATISYGFAAVYGKRFRGMDPVIVSAGQLVASSLLLLPIALFFDSPWNLETPSPRAVGAVVGLALLCTALAYVLFFRVLDGAGATNVSLVTILVPASAILLGVLFLDERFTLLQICGMALIIIGLLVKDGRLQRLWRS